MSRTQPQAILVLPHLCVQNANAISSPLTHGFPSITAFTGFMWALQRKLVQQNIPLKLLSVGVVCHHHQELTTQGFVRTFNLTRNPVDKDGSTAAIVEEGRMHLQVSLVLGVALQAKAPAGALDSQDQRKAWAQAIGEIATTMRIAGGSLLPSRPMPSKRMLPWMEIVSEDPEQHKKDFRRWRRQWLPGFALVARDDVLPTRLQHLRSTKPEATVLDAWLHASRFNYEPVKDANGAFPADGKVQWQDPFRPKGSGWIVPIPVGYAALTASHTAGAVANARDMTTPLCFVESIYSMGAWISPHRLNHLGELLWWAESDAEKGVYRCRNGYQAPQAEQTAPACTTDDDWDEEDDDYVDD